MSNSTPRDMRNRFAAGASLVAAPVTVPGHSVSPDKSGMIDCKDALEIESIVAAILSDKHGLSAEKLQVFEELLDAPNMEAGQRQEFLQTIWNIVVSIIDLCWDNMTSFASVSVDQTGCGQNEKIQYDQNIGRKNVLKCRDQNLSQVYKKAVVVKLLPERKT